MDSDTRPERMTAIVGHELAMHSIAIAVVGGTRRADTTVTTGVQEGLKKRVITYKRLNSPLKYLFSRTCHIGLGLIT